MEIKTTEEILNDRKNEWSFKDEKCQKYYKKKWVALEDVKKCRALIINQLENDGYDWPFYIHNIINKRFGDLTKIEKELKE